MLGLLAGLDLALVSAQHQAGVGALARAQDCWCWTLPYLWPALLEPLEQQQECSGICAPWQPLCLVHPASPGLALLLSPGHLPAALEDQQQVSAAASSIAEVNEWDTSCFMHQTAE